MGVPWLFVISLFCLTAGVPACPALDAWPPLAEKSLSVGSYNFKSVTSESSLAWVANGVTSSISINNGDATIAMGQEQAAYFDMDFDEAGLPLDAIGALDVNVTLSQVNLPSVPANPSFFGDIKPNGFELIKIQGPNNARVGSLVVFREQGVLKGVITYTDGNDNYIQLTDETFPLADDGKEHEYILGAPTISNSDGTGRIFLCEDGVTLIEKNNLNIVTTVVTVIRVGYSLWGQHTSGSLILHHLKYLVPQLPDLYVTAQTGDDANDGTTPASPLATAVRAAEMARAGTTVHLAEGTYRGPLKLRGNGRPWKGIKVVGENNKTAIVGSLRADSLQWSVHEGNIYKADVSGVYGSWKLTKSPRIVCEVDSAIPGVCRQRYYIARAPNYYEPGPPYEYKHIQYWYMADGGAGVPSCTPAPPGRNRWCDEDLWSYTELTDVGHFPDDGEGQFSIPPPGIQPAANLKTLPHLKGAKIFINDGRSGFWTKRFEVATHNRQAGKLTINENFLCRDPALICIRAYAQYFVYDKLNLLDSPGEYWFDEANQRLYMWKNDGVDWSEIEIMGDVDSSDEATGIDLSGKSFVTIDGVRVAFFRRGVIESGKEGDPLSQHVTLTNCHFHAISEDGIRLFRTLDSNVPGRKTQLWTITNNVFSEIDEFAIWSSPNFLQTDGSSEQGRDPTNAEVSIRDFYVAHNYFTRISFHYKNPVTQRMFGPAAVSFMAATNITFVHNVIEYVGGYALSMRYVKHGSDGTPYAAADDVRYGDNLAAWNEMRMASLVKADSGIIAVSGAKPFNTLFYENHMDNTFAWTGTGSRKDSPMGAGSGMYQEWIAGGVYFRNVVWNVVEKAFTYHCSEEMECHVIFLNNMLARARRCVKQDERQQSTPAKSFTLHNNLFVSCSEATDFDRPDGAPFPREWFDVDYNMYYDIKYEDGSPGLVLHLEHGPNSDRQEFTYSTLSDLSAASSGTWLEEWEAHGSDTAYIGHLYRQQNLPPHTNNVNTAPYLSYDKKWFKPQPAQKSASNPSFPAELERLLRRYDICVPMAEDETTLTAGPYSSGEDKCFKGIGKLGGAPNLGESAFCPIIASKWPASGQTIMFGEYSFDDDPTTWKLRGATSKIDVDSGRADIRLVAGQQAYMDLDFTNTADMSYAAVVLTVRWSKMQLTPVAGTNFFNDIKPRGFELVQWNEASSISFTKALAFVVYRDQSGALRGLIGYNKPGGFEALVDDSFLLPDNDQSHTYAIGYALPTGDIFVCEDGVTVFSKTGLNIWPSTVRRLRVGYVWGADETIGGKVILDSVGLMLPATSPLPYPCPFLASIWTSDQTTTFGQYTFDDEPTTWVFGGTTANIVRTNGRAEISLVAGDEAYMDLDFANTADMSYAAVVLTVKWSEMQLTPVAGTNFHGDFKPSAFELMRMDDAGSTYDRVAGLLVYRDQSGALRGLIGFQSDVYKPLLDDTFPLKDDSEPHTYVIGYALPTGSIFVYEDGNMVFERRGLLIWPTTVRRVRVGHATWADQSIGGKLVLESIGLMVPATSPLPYPCPSLGSKWPLSGQKTIFGQYTFGEEPTMWTFGGTAANIVQTNGRAEITLAAADEAYTQLDFANTADMSYAAVALTVRWSEMQLTPAAGTNFWNHIKERGFELVQLNAASPGFPKVVSFVVYRNQSGALRGLIGYNNVDGFDALTSDTFLLEDDVRPHTYVVGYSLPTGDIFVYEDGNMVLDKTGLAISPSTVRRIRVGHPQWGDEVIGGKLVLESVGLLLPASSPPPLPCPCFRTKWPSFNEMSNFGQYTFDEDPTTWTFGGTLDHIVRTNSRAEITLAAADEAFMQFDFADMADTSYGAIVFTVRWSEMQLTPVVGTNFHTDIKPRGFEFVRMFELGSTFARTLSFTVYRDQSGTLRGIIGFTEGDPMGPFESSTYKALDGDSFPLIDDSKPHTYALGYALSTGDIFVCEDGATIFDKTGLTIWPSSVKRVKLGHVTWADEAVGGKVLVESVGFFVPQSAQCADGTCADPSRI